MNGEKWITALVMATIGSVVVCFLILLINESGKRGQAITWLPASLATTLALTYMNTPDELERMLTCAFGSTLSSGVFIFSFATMLESFLPDKKHEFNEGQKDTILFFVSILSTILPAAIILVIETYMNKFWVLISGLLGLGLIMYTVIISPELIFDDNVVTFKITHLYEYLKKCCKIITAKHEKKEINLLIGAVLGTFVFTITPAWLADAGHPNWAGVLANMPKITVLVMISLYLNKGDTEDTDGNTIPEIEKKINLRKELLEHLTMFSYSTGITATYIIVLWFNESEINPEGFWRAWSAALSLSLIFIILILVPVCRKHRNEGSKSVARSLLRNESNAAKVLSPTTVEPNLRVTFQGHPKLKW